MFRIRRIFDDVLPANRAAIAAIMDILAAQFPEHPREEVDRVLDALHHPSRHRFQLHLMVVEGGGGKVGAFAFFHHVPDMRFCYVDYIAAAPGRTGGGAGGALYDRLRELALDLDAVGIFLDCRPDDPQLCPDPQVLRQNRSRLRFYEGLGARPIAGTAYASVFKPGVNAPMYLLFDDLGLGRPLRRRAARAIVRAILERNYAGHDAGDYIDRIVRSFTDDPVLLRPPRYNEPSRPVPAHAAVAPHERIDLVVSEGHAVHHVRERGYYESPARVGAILKELERTPLFQRVQRRPWPDRHVLAVHDAAFVGYLRRMCERLPRGQSVYPDVFPIRNAARLPHDMAERAGYYCIDTSTPLHHDAYTAAREAVDCVMTAADRLLQGSRLGYALVRPPGHHAERRCFGGFCYLNSAAVAAQHLSAQGRVAMLDLDYHHGNGQQNIFYECADVLTVSIHGHPRFSFPYFSGFADERGAGAGEGCNLNLPLGEDVDGPAYRRALATALGRVQRFGPEFLVLLLGLDTAKRDPTGRWALRAADYEANGRLVGALGLPTLVTQEGGYGQRVIGSLARRFLRGLWQGAYGRKA